MFKLSVSVIIRDHFKTLVNANTGKAGVDDYVSFLLLPLLISIGFIWIGFDVDANSIETIVGSLSIFVGLLFNALVILLDVARKQDNSKVKKIIIEQITANISFAILVSFFAIFIMLLGFIDDLSKCLKIAIDFVSFFALTQFLLIFLMILKRIYLIFKDELRDNNLKKP